jgi:hypothetical protein
MGSSRSMILQSLSNKLHCVSQIPEFSPDPSNLFKETTVLFNETLIHPFFLDEQEPETFVITVGMRRHRKKNA